MQIIVFLAIGFVLCFSFFEMEKRNLFIFAVEESEEYCHVLDGKVSEVAKIDGISEKIDKFAYYAYNSNNNLVGCNKFEEPKHSFFLENANKLENKEVRIDLIKRPDKLIPYLMVSTKQEIKSNNKYLGYILAGCEISHKFRRILQIFGVILIVFIVYAFVIYKMTLNLISVIVTPINDALLTQRRFTANASHDLKTPLSIMQMSLECLKRDTDTNLSDFSIETLGDMEKAVQTMKNLTNSLMILAKAENNSENIDMVAVDLCSFVRKITQDYSKLINKKNINLIFSTELGSAPVWLNKDHLELIIANLFDNACKYSKEGREVIVEIKKENNKYSVSVTDFGVGISEKDLPYIFDRFYRVDKSRTTEGVGLGLAISKELALKNNIEIKVESTMGKGSIFKLLMEEFK